MERDEVITLVREHLAEELEVAPTRIEETTRFREDLEAAGGMVLAVTRLGGSFGVTGGARAPDGAGSARLDPGHGAVVGFQKSLALEWPAVRCKAVDLALDADVALSVEQVLGELTAHDGLVEVGYGGGRGITARVAHTLAARHRCTLVLVGRTPEEPEAPLTAGLADAELRGAMIEARRASGEPLTPALVEADWRRIRHRRELRDTLAGLAASGARVEYRACDVADDSAFAALIDEVYARHGRIDGVIHGAGVLADGLVADKRPESLERVMATKADSARTLARALRPDGLRFLALFSSVSGRFGNVGQADYAAASEVLNKLAQELDRDWPARVVSINWGPWRSAGMVSPALEAEFARRGITLIDGETGCRMLCEELELGSKGETEVVIGGARGLSGPSTAALPAAAAAFTVPASRAAGLALLGVETKLTGTPEGGIRATRRFGLTADRYLDDHRVDGPPVLPFAVAMEAMAQAASLTGAGAAARRVTGLQQIRVLKGITVPEPEGIETVVLATPEAGDAVQATIAAGDGGRTRYRARVTLGDADAVGPPAAVPGPDPLAELRPFSRSPAEVYRDLLFHGPLFQGIERIDGLDERGATAWLRASDPERCVAGPAGRGWLLDPILIDCALQMQVVWGRLEWDVTLLPAEIGGYAQLDRLRTGELVRHELRPRPAITPPLCRADHWFLGADGRLIATLSDVVGVGNRALNRLATAAGA